MIYSRIYTIKGIDLNKVVALYKTFCLEGDREIDGDSLSCNRVVEPEYIVKREPRRPLCDDTKIKNKVIYLVHTVAYRHMTSQDGNADGATIQASILQSVIGRDFYELLKALVVAGYIAKSDNYTIGKEAYRYRVLGEIATLQCGNFTICKYIEKSKELLRKEIVSRLSSAEFKQTYGETFAKTYINNLNMFHIKDKKGFNDFAKEQIKLNKDTEPYYNFIKSAFNDKLKIYSIDNNNRIYHILTSLKRELKTFINIKYSIDCSNSHPLLFCYFIYMSKGISISDFYLISSVLSSVSIYHYDIKNLYNVMIDKGIDKCILARFKEDELLYIWKTTHGVFWDEIIEDYAGAYDRAEIKQKMFAEVFYSKTPKIVWKEFAKRFKQQFPNVYRLIVEWKEPLKHKEARECLLRHNKAVEFNGKAVMNNQETALPNVMMALESTIFREILKSLYRKRVHAVHIHDAIVVPDAKSTAKTNPEQIQSVMLNVYKQFGLCPTFKTEYG